jgi:hypothetical protein
MRDSTEILNDDELEALRRRYREDPTALQNLALHATGALYARGRRYVAEVGDLLYGHREPTRFVEPIDREVQLLTLFAIDREPAQLAIHCYWSLLVGLLPEDIAETLLLASLRAGIDEYVSALGVMTKTLHILKGLAPTEPTPEEVVGELLKAF